MRNNTEGRKYPELILLAPWWIWYVILKIYFTYIEVTEHTKNPLNYHGRFRFFFFFWASEHDPSEFTGL